MHGGHGGDMGGTWGRFFWLFLFNLVHKNRPHGLPHGLHSDQKKAQKKRAANHSLTQYSD
jgi:hypothetical protein